MKKKNNKRYSLYHAEYKPKTRPKVIRRLAGGLFGL